MISLSQRHKYQTDRSCTTSNLSLILTSWNRRNHITESVNKLCIHVLGELLLSYPETEALQSLVHMRWRKPYGRVKTGPPIPGAAFSSPGREFSIGWRAGKSWRNQYCIICIHGDTEESHTKSGLFFS